MSIPEKYKNIINSYLKFFSDKELHYPKSDEFIKEYQQDKGGYIDLAKCFENKGTKGKEDDKKYYNFLNSLKDFRKYPAFEIIKKENEDARKVLNFLVDKTKCEPNQKWHLIVSYMGMSYYLFESGKRKRMNHHAITCGELIIWVAEACEVDFVEEIYNNAVKRNIGELSYQKWRKLVKKYWEKFDEIVFAKNV